MKVLVRRNFQVESQHQVHFVVVDAAGKIQSQSGDSYQTFFPRSAIKFLQALPLVESGAASAFHLTNQQLALACASHKAEAMHTDLARNWLRQIGLTEDVLACGPHAPGHLETAREYLRAGRMPTPVCNNCSGKHLGMLTTCLHLGLPTENYEKFDHPLQLLHRKRLSQSFEVDLENAPWGVDGCGIPTSKIPLLNIALGMRELLGSAPASREVVDSVFANPLMIGGHQDLSSQVASLPGRAALIKTGAEGVFCGVLFEQKLAFALKVADGATRASEAAVVYLLKHFGIREIELEQNLRNWKGDLVGDVQVEMT